MSAIGRLWRRAPAWRLLLFVAIATTGLAAMFPPLLPHPGFLHPTGARYVAPAADAGSTDSSATIFMPPITGTRQTLIPFAGRQVPLPLGSWTEITLLQAVGPVAGQGVVLARLQSGRMTGMIIVLGTAPTQTIVPIPQGVCVDPTGLTVNVLASPSGSDLATNECWSLRRMTTSTLVDPRNPLENRSFERLGKLGIEVPKHALASIYDRHDDHGGLSVTILLPDPNQSDSLVHRVDAWTRRWVPLLHRGFDGTLAATDVTPTLARDPTAPGP